MPEASGPPGRPSSAVSRALALTALRRLGPMTRQRLAIETGLSRSTISAVLRSLAADGRVHETPSDADGSRGRPSRLVAINSSQADLVGIEIGRAHVAVAVADGSDRVVGQADHAVAATAPIADRADEALHLVATIAAAHALDLDGVRGVAVGTPGPMFGSPTERHAPGLALARFARDRSAVADLLGRHFGIPVQVDNNTRYRALGEASSGAGAGASHVAYLRLDEGVGGGVVADGALLSGRWGTAGEFGHVCVDAAGPRCSCGGRGCLELVAALPALLAATGAADPAALATVATDRPQLLEPAVRACAQALAGAVSVLDVSLIVLGGRVAELPGFLDRTAAAVREIAPSWCTDELTVRAAHDDRRAGAHGALLRARAAVEQAAQSPIRPLWGRGT